MTERLYYRDAALLEFDAVVVDHVGDAQHVVLDRTAFYPTSGGQPHDIGALGDALVTNVIDEGDRIVHITSTAVPMGPVRGAVDSVRRRDYMQQHTAQHLLSALAAGRLNWATTSVHFGVDRSSIEFDAASVSGRQLANLERWANDAVADARAVTVSFEDASTANLTGLRKPSGRLGEVRVVTISETDRSACGGTHVTRTSEIGPVLLLGTEKVRGNSRVGFLAGDRVLGYAHATDDALQSLAGGAGCAVSELDSLIPARQQELKSAREEIGRLGQELAVSRVRALYDGTPPGADGVRRISLRAKEESAALLRAMAHAVAPLQRALFVAVAGSPPAICFATSNDSGVDAGMTLRPHLTAVAGRGGGSARVAQGTAPTVEALEKVSRLLLDC